MDRARGRLPRLAPLVPGLLAAALLLAGCGRGEAPRATPAATAAPAALVASPSTLKSYRYAIAVTVAGGSLAGAGTPAPAAPTAAATGTGVTGDTFTIDITGDVVNPDREHTLTKASLGFIQLSLERIEIGNNAWTREAGGTWQRATPGAASSDALGANVDISPARLFAQGGGTFTTLNQQLGQIASTPDKVNGVLAHRYDLTAAQFRAVFAGAQGLLPGEAERVNTQGSLWVGDDSHVPLRLRLQSTAATGEPAFQMDMTLSDLNGDIGVTPPA